MMKRIRWKRVAIGASLLLLGVASGVAIYRVRAQNLRMPILVQMADQYPDENGVLQTRRLMTQAVRADGSWMTEVLVLSPDQVSVGPSREIALLPSLEVIDYNPANNTKSTSKIGPRFLARFRGSVPNDCLAANPGPGTATCVASGESVLGYPVMKVTRVFYPNGDGSAVRTEELVAPSLEWRPLAYTRYRNNVLKEKRVAMYVTVGEPAPGLFTVPAGAVEVRRAY